MFRRSFLKAGSMVLAGGLMSVNFKVFSQTVKSGDHFNLPENALSDRLGSFNAQVFEPFLNTDFTVNEKDFSAVSLRLVEIVNNKYKEKSLFGKTTDGFSLIFEHSEGDVLEDRIYKFSHPEMGEFSLFISSFERTGKHYQAVFSRVYF